MKTLLRNIWITFRPHFFSVSGAAGLTGMILAYQDPPLWKTAATFFVCFFSYGLIQALCDTFDLETDRINAPFRPMVTGALKVRTLWIVLGSLLAGVAILFAIINPLMLVFQALALIFSFTYNRMKRVPNAGPVWNGIIVATLPFLGALGVSDIASVAEFPEEVYAFSALVCLVYAGFVLTGYFKDVEGDSRTGYRTAPVYYGITAARWHVLPFTVIALAGVPYFLSLSPPDTTGNKALFLVLCMLAVGILIASNISLIKNPSAKTSYGSLLWYTRGMVLYFLSPIAIIDVSVAVLSSVSFMALLEFFLSKTKGTYQA